MFSEIIIFKFEEFAELRNSRPFNITATYGNNRSHDKAPPMLFPPRSQQLYLTNTKPFNKKRITFYVYIILHFTLRMRVKKKKKFKMYLYKKHLTNEWRPSRKLTFMYCIWNCEIIINRLIHAHPAAAILAWLENHPPVTFIDNL